MESDEKLTLFNIVKLLTKQYKKSLDYVKQKITMTIMHLSD